MRLKVIHVLLFFVISVTSYSQSPPVGNDDAYTTPVNTPLNVDTASGLLANDTDPDGDPITLVSFIIDGVEYLAGETASFAGGTITINADGSFTFTPSAGFTGGLPPITYTLTDGTETVFSTVFITVTTPGPPVANNDFDTADIDTPLNVSAPGVLANDTYNNINNVSVVSFEINGVTYNAGQTATLAEGSFTLNADGSYVFVPAPGYTGPVPEILYTITSGGSSSTATLFLTVEPVDDLIQIQGLTSCNQGYSVDGNYRISISFRITNMSRARDYHPSSIIENIDLIKDLDNIYGAGCVVLLEDMNVSTVSQFDFIGNPYPLEFDLNSVNQDFINGNSSVMFTQESIDDARLYPRQSINVNFCVVVNPFCGGRPNPTASGSGVDFNLFFDVTSSKGDFLINLLLQDFHTTEAILTAGFFVPEPNPPINPDGTFDYINSIIITNDGNQTANNINFNLGLGGFLDNGLVFNTLTVTQVSGPAVSVNTNYDGDTNTLLLDTNNSLDPGETIVLEIFHLLEPVPTQANNFFEPINPSQTQGPLDGFDETTPDNRRNLSYVLWEDGLGNHLDRYYTSTSATGDMINNQCQCDRLSMAFIFFSEAESEKTITNVNEAPNGILEHEELTFQLSVTNTSPVLDLIDVQLQDDLSSICGNPPISFTQPVISSSTATQTPILNPNYDGINDINIFDGNSGVLMTGETVIVEFSVTFSEDCVGLNSMTFEGSNPIGEVVTSTATVDVTASTDTDNDGISNVDDIDDDNDTILDIEESNGQDPLGDSDGDLIPDYRDPDFGPDTNNDGIVDSFDFDMDGVPNHFDLDSDNDGIFDIYEVNNFAVDADANGQTDNPTGVNGLDDTLETDDTFSASVTYTIPSSDADPNPDYLDIDADGDGIVDNIEAQPTDNYTPPDGTVDLNGVDTAYPTGLVPIDTEGDNIPDYLDLNADDDFEDDDIEGWDFANDGIAETLPTGVDADNDGLDDGYDNDPNAVNPTNGQVPTDFPNVDFDVTFERDWREDIAVNLIVDNVSAIEGNTLDFTLTLVRFSDNITPTQLAAPVDVVITTSDGTATSGPFEAAIAGLDYVALTDFSATIPAFTSSIPISITTIDDNLSELDELLTLDIQIITTNTVNSEAQGIGTIIDDEPLPNITMNNDTVPEGEDLVYNIDIDIPSSTPIEIAINTFDNTAISPEDYTSLSAFFVIDPTIDEANPNLNASFSIPTLLDNLNEMDSEFLNVNGAVTTNNVGNQDLQKTGTIIDIDPKPFLVINDDTVVEGNTLSFTISLLNLQGQLMRNYLPITFDLETADITTTVNRDYMFFSDSAVIPALESSYNQLIPTIDDNLNEETETMHLNVTNIQGTISNSSNFLQGLGTIKDNDIPNLFSPNGDGQSDVFRIDGIEEFPNFKLIIVDRWGGEIYNYSNNGSTSPQWWDGTHNGKEVIEGVYFYTLDYNDGITKPQTGFIQLVR